MANQLTDKILVSGGYVDANTTVSSINELYNKYDAFDFFMGQSLHMPKAFKGVNGYSYPIDFWVVPMGNDFKWELKNVPSIESDTDFELF